MHSGMTFLLSVQAVNCSLWIFLLQRNGHTWSYMAIHGHIWSVHYVLRSNTTQSRSGFADLTVRQVNNYSLPHVHLQVGLTLQEVQHDILLWDYHSIMKASPGKGFKGLGSPHSSKDCRSIAKFSECCSWKS